MRQSLDCGHSGVPSSTQLRAGPSCLGGPGSDRKGVGDMSTKMTRQYGEDFHLYAECFDMDPETGEESGRLWLDLDGTSFSVKELSTGRMRVTVGLKPEVLAALRRELAPDKELYEGISLLEEATAYLLWCLENKLADTQGAIYAVKKLVPKDALKRYNRRWGGK